MPLSNTFLGTAGVTQLLKGRKKLWFIGIGGIHMHALALACRARGFAVAGSDTVAGVSVKKLRAAGIPVHVGHHPAAVSEQDAVVYTLAIDERDPEYLAAVRLGIPVLSRADLLGFLTASYPRRIGVAGSHGKSTVTAMLAEIFEAAGRDPTVFCGAPLPSGEAVRLGKGTDCIFEACEYKNSFLSLSPTLSLILNVDFDHADFFADEVAFGKAFAAFGALPDKEGLTVFNEEEEGAVRAAARARGKKRSFGLARGDFHAENIKYVGGRGEFSLILDGVLIGEVRLRVPGEHNVKNALAAALCAAESGIRSEKILQGLTAFKGAARRMEYRGLFHGVRLFDDYAHHPAEITASLRAARQITPKTGRVFAVFQPHTYTRTKAFFDAFCKALSVADRVIVAEIYPARETDTLGMSAKRLADGIGAHAAFVGDFCEIAKTLSRELAPGDTLLVMGAGDVDRLFSQICSNHFTLSEK